MRRILIALAAFAVTFSPVPAHAQICTPFSDVAASDPFCSNIQWMYNRGITLGCTANQYCPAQFVRRDQMAAFMFRLGNVVFQQGGNAFAATGVLGTTDNQPLDIRVNSARVMRYEPNAISPNVIGGSAANNVTAGVRGATIAGGGVPTGDTDPNFGTGPPNRVTDAYGTVGGGYANRAGDDAGTTTDSPFATVGGGGGNTASNFYSAVAGGGGNTASGYANTVAGGFLNTASDFYSAVAGGLRNTASGGASAVAGGYFNTASGYASFAAGQYANANGDNCAVFSLWGSSPGMQCFGIPGLFIIGAPQGFSIDYNTQRGDGGGTRWVAIGPRFAGQTIATWTGAYLSDGGAWTNASDANAKHGFAELDQRAVLDKLAAMPIRSWRYNVESDDVRHIGPTAQDFMAAFGLGYDDKTIGTIDADGVALAAIQGLNAKLEATLAERDARIASLAQDLAQERSAREAQAREIGELRQAVGVVLGAVKNADRLAARAP